MDFFGSEIGHRRLDRDGINREWRHYHESFFQDCHTLIGDAATKAIPGGESNINIRQNVPASIHQRLLNKAKEENRPFNELVQYFAIEKFLYRLSKSVHSDMFVLKGALILHAWQSPEIRPTKDIDLLGKTNNEESSIIIQREIVYQIRDFLFPIIKLINQS